MNSAPANGMHASKLMGADVKTANDENVGSVSDLIIDHEGQIVAIIVGVGGFLGMSERDVAIGWDDVTRAGSNDDNDLRINSTRDELRNAPEFQSHSDQRQRGVSLTTPRNSQFATGSSSSTPGSAQSTAGTPRPTAGSVQSSAGTQQSTQSSAQSSAETLSTSGSAQSSAGTPQSTAGTSQTAIGSSQASQSSQRPQQSETQTAANRMTASGQSRMANRGFMESVPGNGMHASNLIGADVKTSNGDDVGPVNDLIIDHEGQVVAIIIGVGGFLGIGERDVAIGWDDVTRAGSYDDQELRVNVTRESVRSAPEFSAQD